MPLPPHASPSLAKCDATGHIAALWVYPIKSCAGIRCDALAVHAHGLAWDRHWMVITPNGHFLTQRDAPHMACIVPVLDESAGTLTVHAPQQAPLTLALAAPERTPHTTAVVWDDAAHATDAGDAAAAWFTRAVGQPCRLVRSVPNQPRLTSGKWTQGVQAPVFFADAYPLLITTEAAVHELNTRLQAQGHSAIDGLRFRANIVLGGLGAHEEDFTEQLWVHSATGTGASVVGLQPCKPCARCPIPNIDPATGTSSPEVGMALQTYRADARVGGALTFGMNAVVNHGAGTVLRVGDAVGAVLRFD